SRVHSGSGKDPLHSRRNFCRHVAIWHANLRSIFVGFVPGRTHQLRNRTRERFQRRRLQAAYAGRFFNERYFAQCDAGHRLRRRPLSVFRKQQRRATCPPLTFSAKRFYDASAYRISRQSRPAITISASWKDEISNTRSIPTLVSTCFTNAFGFTSF